MVNGALVGKIKARHAKREDVPRAGCRIAGTATILATWIRSLTPT